MIRVFARPAALALGLVTLLVSCPNPPVQPILSGVKLATETVTLEINKTQTLTATPVDQFDKPFSGATVTWSVTDANVASINAQTGFLTAKKFGVVKVKASTDGFSDEAEVIVKNPPNATKTAQQRQVKRTSPQNGLSFGYLEYKPQDWGEDPTKYYPLIIFLHGIGEKGDGGSGALDTLLLSTAGGPAPYINANQLDSQFVILTPQLKDNGDPNQTWDNSIIQTLIDKGINDLRVDPKRVYLTGTSLGGGGVFKFSGTSANNASKLAAEVALVPSNRGNSYSNTKACNIASGSHAVLTIYAGSDPYNSFVSSAIAQEWVNGINGTNGSGCTAPAPNAKYRTEVGPSHESIPNVVFAPSYRIDGKSIYDWLLQYKR